MHAFLRKAKRPDEILVQEAPFILVIVTLTIVAYLLFPYPALAMWFGFGVAGYSAIANDSIQTLGTFLSSNRKLPWWVLWFFIGGILVVAHVHSWIVDGGDIAFGRLTKIDQPQTFTFLSLSAPIILLILTKFRMPVSTTFLLLSAFSSTVIIQKMLMKTFLGYLVAFVAALVVWTVLAFLYHHHEFPRKTYNIKKWRVYQACSTAFLWCTWVMHDTANVAVSLPRVLTFPQMALAVGYLFVMIGFIMYKRGGSIQVVVTEKTDITDVRAATIIDFVYAIVLLVFKQWSNIPMSTTWVFLGLLAGREIALALFTVKPGVYWRTTKLVGKDIVRASMGLLISLLIVLAIL